jgi:hypothetical protein
MVANTETAIWGRVMKPDNGDLSAAAARAILRLNFHSTDLKRMNSLAAKAQHGTLSLEEREEIENYNRVGHLLALLQSKARKSLRRGGRKP